MKKSTKVLFGIFITFCLPSVVMARYIFSAISFAEGKINFDFNAYSVSAIVLSVVALILGNILFVRFIKSLSLERAIFFSSTPLVVLYGISMFWLSGLSTYKGGMSKTISSALNISVENQYNTILWAVFISLVFVIVLFINYFLLAKPVSKIERVVARLGDGNIKNERIKLGGTTQFRNIAYGLNKINNNYNEKYRMSPLNGKRKQKYSKNMWRLFGKNDLANLEKGLHVKKHITIVLLKLVEFDNKRSLEQSYHIANSYFNIISPLIERFDGVVTDFGGDGLLAVFPSAPQALNCVGGLAKNIKSASRREKHVDFVHLKTIMHASSVEFALMGEKVQIVSEEKDSLLQIDQASMSLQVGAIFTKTVLDDLPLEFKFAYLYIGTIKVAETEQFLFENLEVLSRERQKRLIKSKNLFEKGVELYQSRLWGKAQTCFEKVLKYDSSDNCAYIYFNNCKDKIV